MGVRKKKNKVTRMHLYFEFNLSPQQIRVCPWSHSHGFSRSSRHRQPREYRCLPRRRLDADAGGEAYFFSRSKRSATELFVRVLLLRPTWLRFCWHRRLPDWFNSIISRT